MCGRYEWFPIGRAPVELVTFLSSLEQRSICLQTFVAEGASPDGTEVVSTARITKRATLSSACCHKGKVERGGSGGPP